MEAQLTRRAFTVFEDALDIYDPAQREAFIVDACGDDALLAEVRKLLRADAAAERVMPTGGLLSSAFDKPAAGAILAATSGRASWRTSRRRS